MAGWAEFDPDVAASGYPVDVRFTPEARIGRFWGIPWLGIWLRAILLIPHFIALVVMGIAAVLVSLVTWVPVLITGRYPSWGYGVVGGYLRWGVRVLSWLYLMSGTYPAFTGGEAEAQHVRVRFDEDQRIGRFWGIPILGIAIRAVILIPHYIVLMVLAILAAILIWFVWLPVLILGRQAELVYVVVGGYIRWYTRVVAYLLLLSGRYPPFRLD